VNHDAHHVSVPGGGEHPPLPVSAGITLGVKLLILGGLVLALTQGLLTVIGSPFGRVWPAEASARIPLPPPNFP
jgi:hypothetical protein